MTWLELWFPEETPFLPIGGLFLDSNPPTSFLSSIASHTCSISNSNSKSKSIIRYNSHRKNGFLSVSLSVKGNGIRGSVGLIECNGEKGSTDEMETIGDVAVLEKKSRSRGAGAVNTTKHLWAGAIAAMVSRTIVAPLERLKLEYMVRGEQGHLFPLIHKIASTQGIRGFWKGNFVNILRTAPFKAVNFYAYDSYRKQFLKISGNEEITNFERFLAGAFAGVTATVMCIPMDTIRTKMVAPGGEALGGVIGAFHHVITTEGFFSLYKGLVPSLISMAPSGAVFYGVYDILKQSYLRSPEGKTRISQNLGADSQNAFDKLELGPTRTLLYGAIAGACAEAATYPFEVVRRQLQLQAKANRMNSVKTLLNIVEKGGVPALYAGLIPSLLQLGPTDVLTWGPDSNERVGKIVGEFVPVCRIIYRGLFMPHASEKVLPSASISYFVYEIMKIVLKVE